MPADLPELKPGDAIPRTARYYNLIREWIRTLRVQVAPGGELELKAFPGGGTQIAFTRYKCIKVARVPSGGIAARSGNIPGSVDCTSLAFDGVRYRNATTVKVYNWTSSAIAAGAYIVVGKIEGYWHVLAEECVATPLDTTGFSTGFSPGFGVSSTGGTSSGTDSGFDGGFSSGFGTTKGNEIQRLYHTGGPPSSGWFWFTIEGMQIGGILGPDVPYNISASSLQGLIDAVIGAGKVSCTGGPHNVAPIDIEFIGSLAGSNRATITIDGTSAGYTGTPTITVIQEGG